MTDLGFEKHPDKTFIGRTDKGFDLGFHLCTTEDDPIATEPNLTSQLEALTTTASTFLPAHLESVRQVTTVASPPNTQQARPATKI